MREMTWILLAALASPAFAAVTPLPGVTPQRGTALSPFAAAAITGADPYRTTMQAWKYTMPAFVVPFFFVLDPLGTSLLLKPPAAAAWPDVAWVIFLGFVAIAALAAGLQGWMFGRTSAFERTLLLVGGTLLVLPLAQVGIEGAYLPVHADWVGIGLIVIAVLAQVARRPRATVPA